MSHFAWINLHSSALPTVTLNDIEASCECTKGGLTEERKEEKRGGEEREWRREGKVVV